MSQVSILVGTQWGDEGKGKWVDVLAQTHDITARFQGGNNAGHTLKLADREVVLHHLPSGILHEQNVSALLNGVVINPIDLAQEMEKIGEIRKIEPHFLMVSGGAHTITPWHLYLDNRMESSSSRPIGTTRKGIGPTYSDRARRSGLRMNEYVNDSLRAAWMERMSCEEPDFQQCYEKQRAQWDQFENTASVLEPFVCEAEIQLRRRLASGSSVLFEGAQGILLDVDHGTYPFVTSSSTLPAAACVASGIHPRLVSKIYGIAKAYVTRVGGGPFPTELTDPIGQHLATKGCEFGATTRRPRRCGWLDGVALRHTCEIGGIDALILNKVDILTGLDQVAIATAYDHPTMGRIDTLPSSSEELSRCKPVYTYYRGWSQIEQHLPNHLRAFIDAIEETVQTKITMIGIGPGPEDFIEVR